jgi:hypothetical protein
VQFASRDLQDLPPKNGSNRNGKSTAATLKARGGNHTVQ